VDFSLCGNIPPDSDRKKYCVNPDSKEITNTTIPTSQEQTDFPEDIVTTSGLENEPCKFNNECVEGLLCCRVDPIKDGYCASTCG